MASSYIPLDQIFGSDRTTAAQKALTISLLQSGEIRAISAESVKANLCLLYVEDNLSSAIKRLPLEESSRKIVFEQAGRQNEVYRVWADGDYFTIQHVKHDFRVFTYRDYRQVFPEHEIHPDFWKSAWIDDERWVVLCDDLINLLRREFMRVGLSRDDFQKHVAPHLQRQRNPRGPKTRYRVEAEVCHRAKTLLLQQPDISQTRWSALVLDCIVGPKPQRTAFNNLYGHLYTAHRNGRKSAN